MKRLTSIILMVLVCLAAGAQTDFGAAVRFDRTVYDFGDIAQNAGPVSCTFTLKNISDDAWTVDQVASSCGCTGVKWTRSAVAPGKEASLNVTYLNDEGPYPFDKTLTVYVSALKKPVVIHVRGVARPGNMSLKDSYPVHFGPLALRDREIKAGNMSQGESRSGEITVANISSKPISVSFTDISQGLSIRLKETRIPAHGTGTLVYTVAASRERWGENFYYATPLVNGRELSSTGEKLEQKPVLGTQAIDCDSNDKLVPGSSFIAVSAVTKEAASYSDNPSAPVLETPQSSFSFGKKKVGTVIKASFALKNSGKEKLLVYKVEPCTSRLKCCSLVDEIAAGEQQKLSFELDTRDMEPGEHLFIVNLYTNAPRQSVRSIYVAGILE